MNQSKTSSTTPKSAQRLPTRPLYEWGVLTEKAIEMQETTEAFVTESLDGVAIVADQVSRVEAALCEVSI